MSKKQDCTPQTTELVIKRKKTSKQSDKIARLCEYLELIHEEGLTGHIKVNFNQGNICKIEKHEEVLRD